MRYRQIWRELEGDRELGKIATWLERRSEGNVERYVGVIVAVANPLALLDRA